MCRLLHRKNGASVVAYWAVRGTTTYEEEALRTHLFTCLTRLQTVSVGVAFVNFAFFIVVFNGNIVGSNEAIFENFVEVFFNIVGSGEVIVIFFFASSSGATRCRRHCFGVVGFVVVCGNTLVILEQRVIFLFFSKIVWVEIGVKVVNKCDVVYFIAFFNFNYFVFWIDIYLFSWLLFAACHKPKPFVIALGASEL